MKKMHPLPNKIRYERDKIRLQDKLFLRLFKGCVIHHEWTGETLKYSFSVVTEQEYHQKVIHKHQKRYYYDSPNRRVDLKL